MPRNAPKPTIIPKGLLRVSQGGGGLSSGLTRSTGGFSSLRRSLRLVQPDEDQMTHPTDISHLYKVRETPHDIPGMVAFARVLGESHCLSTCLFLTPTSQSILPPNRPSIQPFNRPNRQGYAPLSIRLVEAAISGGGWTSISDALASLPGSHFDTDQVVEPTGQIADRPHKPTGTGSGSAATAGGGGADAADAATAAAGSSGGAGGDAAGEGRETVLVVFLGGATFTELSALRFIQQRPDSKVRFLMLVTRVVNGRTLLDGFVDPLVRGFPGGAGAAPAI
jgi:hypothetical protein